jgi:hypothetical protein
LLMFVMFVRDVFCLLIEYAQSYEPYFVFTRVHPCKCL